jgi:hypothetical protein
MTGYGMFDPAYTDDVLAAIVVSVVGYLTSSAKPLAISAPETVRRKVNSLMPGWNHCLCSGRDDVQNLSHK